MLRLIGYQQLTIATEQITGTLHLLQYQCHGRKDHRLLLNDPSQDKLTIDCIETTRTLSVVYTVCVCVCVCVSVCVCVTAATPLNLNPRGEMLFVEVGWWLSAHYTLSLLLGELRKYTRSINYKTIH
jgi:hypothetical protein